MKQISKILAIIALLVLSIISINAAEGAQTITIEGKGVPYVLSDPKGVTEWTCKQTSTNPCKITIEYEQ